MSTVTDAQRQAFHHAFLTAMLWAGLDDNDTPLDQNRDISDIHPNTLAGLKDDCNDFIDRNQADLLALDQNGYGFQQAGHDYLLSRNGHGAGFFDRDLGEVGDRLQEAAQASGQADAYVGDDGKIYVVGLETFGEPAKARGPKP